MKGEKLGLSLSEIFIALLFIANTIAAHAMAFYGLGYFYLIIMFASLFFIASLYITAPEGYEDETGFHYGAPPTKNAEKRNVA